MKISTKILKEMRACESGFDRFKSVHGDAEILFSDCIKSESNTMQDYCWFIRKQSLNDAHTIDLQLLAIEFAERVLPIFESKYPEDNRPRVAIETAKLYLSGESTLDILKEARRAADAAYVATYTDATYTDATDAADAAYAAAYAAAYVVYAADTDATTAVYAAAYAAYVVYAADTDAAERSWQKQQLAKLMVKWGW